MENIEALNQEIALLQKKLELMKQIEELQGKLSIPQKQIEYVPYPVYIDRWHDYPRPWNPYQYWEPYVISGTGTIPCKMPDTITVSCSSEPNSCDYVELR